jgi:hypothetical protein
MGSHPVLMALGSVAGIAFVLSCGGYGNDSVGTA